MLNNNDESKTFNSLIRTRNIFGNKQAPSRDIAQGFGILEHLRSYVQVDHSHLTERKGMCKMQMTVYSELLKQKHHYF